MNAVDVDTLSHVLSCLAVCAPLLGAGADLSSLEVQFARIFRAARAEIGVSLVHVESAARFSIQGDKRFPMASVYKLPIALELLTQVSQGTLALSQPVSIGASDIRACCTLSRRHPRGGVTLTAGELLELMMVESDNTASDAVLKLVGGPVAVERRLRELGFAAINVNRYDGEIAFEMTGVRQPPPEPQWTLELQRRLIAAVPRGELRAARARYARDPRDTATPDDMAALLVRLQRGELLPRPQTDLLLGLMAHATTGPRRLRSRLPPDTVVAHKTGTTDVVNHDVGIITLPENGGHLVLAVFAMNGRVTAMQNAIAQFAATAYERFTGQPLPPPKPSKPATKKRIPRARL